MLNMKDKAYHKREIEKFDEWLRKLLNDSNNPWDEQAVWFSYAMYEV